MKTVRRPPYPKWNPGYFPCSSLTPPSAFLTPSIGVLRWIRVYLAPFPGMDAKIALAAPGELEILETFDENKIRQFIDDNLDN